MQINIAVGNSRKSTKWRNQKLSWPEFIDKLSEPIRTKESSHDYINMPKNQKDEIKDVGGFVGGYLKGGRRISGACVSRSLITLDADSGTENLLTNIDILTDYESVIYSTHSHQKNAPRFRVVIPLYREVTPDEYVPLALKLAEDLGIEQFDPTTYQDTRLMYWPSVSLDADYYFEHREGKFVDPDEVLSRYVDWKDVSEWPVVGENYVKRQQKTQGNPIEKPGLIGAFNKVYTIPEAINEFLQDEYKDAGNGRYSFTGGHTVGGLVVYDDETFAYSNHATDPAGGKLVNAYDLVRLHRFGELDIDTPPETPVAKLPSSKAMSDFARNDSRVKLELTEKRLAETANDFDVQPEREDEEDEGAWIARLEVDKSGVPTKTARNLEIIMSNDPALKGKIAIDEFANKRVLLDHLPWRKRTDAKPYWLDSDDSALRVYLEKRYNQRGKDMVLDALVNVSERYKYHPVRDYLRALEWDGEERVETLLVDYLGAEDTAYTRIVTRKFLAAAVARIMRPGVKFDNVLVTLGNQGIGKTLLAQKLGGKWFSNSLDSVQGKDAYEALQGNWIIELGEMSATKKADIDAVKQFVSKTSDSFRAAYGRNTETHFRQCVFWGTTNEHEFLRDRTGNRRFWPVSCAKEGGAKKPWNLKDDERDQIWAEAYQIWKKGEVLSLNAKENVLALAQQNMHTESDDILGLIEEYVKVPITENWYNMSPNDRKHYISSAMSSEEDLEQEGKIPRTKVCVIEVWVEALGGDLRGMHPAKAAQIRQALHNLEGWERHESKDQGRMKFGVGYGRQTAFNKIDI